MSLCSVSSAVHECVLQTYTTSSCVRREFCAMMVRGDVVAAAAAACMTSTTMLERKKGAAF